MWYGKTGKPLARRHVMRINAQCEAGVPTFLYLVQRVRKLRSVQGSGRAMSRDYPKLESRFVPEYYAQEEFLKGIRLWTKLKQTFAGSRRRVAETRLSEHRHARTLVLCFTDSMAGLFIVKKVQL